MTGHICRGRVKGTWYLRVELPRGANKQRRQRRETFRGDKEEAVKRLRDLLREVENGAYTGSGRQTVSAIAQDWLNATTHRVGVRTLANYKAHVKHYIDPTIGSLKAERLMPAHVEHALAEWNRGIRHDRVKEAALQPRTIAHAFATLRTLCRWALTMGILIRNPVDAVKPPRVERREMRTLDPAGVAALFELFRGSELEAPVVAAVGTGLRRGELLGLRWGDVDLNNRRLTVRRSVETLKGITRTKELKTARSARTLALPPFVVDVLRSRRDEQLEHLAALHGDLEARRRQRDCWVFTRADQQQWIPHVFSLTFARRIRASKVPRVRFHDLRHTFGTIALQSGVDLKTVSTALGHSTISITANIYLHAVEALAIDAADRIEALIEAAVAERAKAPSSISRAAQVPRVGSAARKT